MKTLKKVKRLVCLQEDSKGDATTVESKATKQETVGAGYKEMTETTTEQRQELAITARRRDISQPTVPS